MVCPNPGLVEQWLADRVLACPIVGCGGHLGPWGWAKPRQVWTSFRSRGDSLGVTPRRGRCFLCGRTQVLLDQRFLSRRCNALAVITQELELAARGLGARKIAVIQARPISTVRDRLRTARKVAPLVIQAVGQVVQLVAADAGSLVPMVSSNVLADLVRGLAGLATALGWSSSTDWLMAGASVCRSQILCPSWWATRAQHEFALTGLGVVKPGWMGGQKVSGPP